MRLCLAPGLRLAALVVLWLGAAVGPGWGATYYVAPAGDDASPGSRTRPFATWQKAHDMAAPGDTIYLRGGIYRVSGQRRQGVLMRGRSGKPGAPIRFWAYPGERPTLDCRGLTSDKGISGVRLEADWWHLRGLTIINVPEVSVESNSLGMTAHNVRHCVFEDMEFHHNGGVGLGLSGRLVDNLVRNCDAHDNYDELARGEDADGFHLAFTTTDSTGNRFEGCRSWRNSDDGFDLWEADAAVTIDSCWAFWNGYAPDSWRETPGNGNGFKLGRNAHGPRHALQRSLAFENLHCGIVDNGATGPQEWYNNTSYANRAANFAVWEKGYPYRLRNNVSYRGGKPDDFDAAVDQAHNSWTLPIAITEADFVSLKSLGCDGPRQRDGRLPRPDFLALAPGSRLIGRGVDTRLPHRGAPPDLGARAAFGGRLRH